MSRPKRRTLYNPLNRQRWCYSDRIVSSYSPLFKLIVRHRTGIRPDCLNQSLHGLLMHIVSHGPLCKQGEINFIHVAVLYFVFVLMCQIIVEIKKTHRKLKSCDIYHILPLHYIATVENAHCYVFISPELWNTCYEFLSIFCRYSHRIVVTEIDSVKTETVGVNWLRPSDAYMRWQPMASLV